MKKIAYSAGMSAVALLLAYLISTLVMEILIMYFPYKGGTATWWEIYFEDIKEGVTNSVVTWLIAVFSLLFHVLVFLRPQLMTRKIRLALLGGLMGLLSQVAGIALSLFHFWFYTSAIYALLMGCLYGLFFYYLVGRRMRSPSLQ